MRQLKLFLCPPVSHFLLTVSEVKRIRFDTMSTRKRPHVNNLEVFSFSGAIRGSGAGHLFGLRLLSSIRQMKQRQQYIPSVI